MWFWRKVGKGSWTDRVGNGGLQRVTEEKNILLIVKGKKDI